MNSNLPDDNTIREYLLGRLPEKDWNEIEEKLLSDKEFADFADSIEDEIIEEYLTIQNYFLRPPERQRKLLFATVLNSRLKKSAKEPVPIDRPRTRTTAPRFYWAMASAAAVLLVSTLCLTAYAARLNTKLGIAAANISVLKGKLGANFIDLGATVRSIDPSSQVPPPDFSVTPGMKSLRIRLSIDEMISTLYSVELRTGGLTGTPRWSQTNLQPDSGALVFITPYYGTGDYYLNISRPGDPLVTIPRTYSFHVIEQTEGSAAKH